jgi:ATP-dependent DNA ligase
MTVRLAMKFTEVDPNLVDVLITNPDWVFEQKFDGTRGLAVLTPEGMRMLHSGGGTLAHTSATQHLPAIMDGLVGLAGMKDFEVVLDGEIMTQSGDYHIFDMPYMRYHRNNPIRPDTPFRLRRAALEVMANDGMLTGPNRLPRQARTREEKSDLFMDVVAAGAEGLIAKHVLGAYQPGVQTDVVRKLKLVKTADVVVGKVNRPDARHGSCTFGVYNHDGRLVEVGGCSLIGKPHVETGDVIEVNYLYFTGDALYQPRLMRVREDKLAAACTIDQFPAYTRKVL